MPPARSSWSMERRPCRTSRLTYRPSARTDPNDGRSATFQLKDRVRLFGGYAGLGAPDPDLRDPDAYVSILSGDLAGNDGPNFQNNADNSYHVVTTGGLVRGQVWTA